MPIMPRVKGKAQRIAYKILGVPSNMRKTKIAVRDSNIKKRLSFEETRLVR